MPIAENTTRVSLICEHCHQPFFIERRVFERWHSRFCSSACWGASRVRPASERFWKYVNKDGPIPPHRPDLGPCWIWTGGHNGLGYGRFFLSNPKRRIYAHVFSYTEANGPLALGFIVCHHCDHPPCIRPSHLFSGTRIDNQRDAAQKGRLPGPGLKGEKHAMAILTETQVLEIRQLRLEGWKLQQLADTFGIASKSHIQRIVTGESWKHVR